MSPIINITDPVGCCPYGDNQDIGSACKLENRFFFLFKMLYLSSRVTQTTMNSHHPALHFQGLMTWWTSEGPRKVFPLSSAQGALRGPAFYECVKCLVDALYLIYDHNNNGAAGLRKRQQPRENKIWKHKALERNVILQRLSGGWDTRGVEIKGRGHGTLQTAGSAEGFYPCQPGSGA